MNRIATAFFVGVIGTFVALAFAPHFWWLGSLLGFAAGYISCDWRGFVAAIPKAAARAYEGLPTKAVWKAAGHDFISGFCVGMQGVVLVSSILFFSDGFREPLPVFRIAIVYAAFCTCIALLFGLGAFGSPKPGSAILPSPKYLFPPFTYGWYLPKMILWTIPRYLYSRRALAKPAFWDTWRFLRFLFIEVHSSRRLLRGFDYALGVAVGYLFGNVLIGGLAAAVIAEVDLELVSRRWLGLSVR